MPVLDVYKERKHHVIKAGERSLKVPVEYTVDEVERLLELHAQRDAIEESYVSKSDQKAQEEALLRFWAVVFDQLEIIFGHYQPDITAVELKGLFSHKEALDILGFWDKYRYLNQEKAEEADQAKKKL